MQKNISFQITFLLLLLLNSINSLCMKEPIANADKNMRLSLLSKELFIAVAATSNDEVRDELRRVCKFFGQRLSIKGPYLHELILHPLFNTSAKNKTFIAFNAAWNNQLHLLKCIVPKIKQADYEYTYLISSTDTGELNLADLIADKMVDKAKELQDIAEKQGCALIFAQYNFYRPHYDLEMAAYNKDGGKIETLLSSTLQDNWDYDWKKCMYIAIDRDSAHCIDRLSSLYKKNRESRDSFFMDCPKHTEFLLACKQSRFQEFSSFLIIAMKAKKYNAFEALIKNDFFDCLHFIHQVSHEVVDRHMGLVNTVSIIKIKKTILDFIIEYTLQNNVADGHIYKDICINHGGKTAKEMSPPCVIQ